MQPFRCVLMGGNAALRCVLMGDDEWRSKTARSGPKAIASPQYLNKAVYPSVFLCASHRDCQIWLFAGCQPPPIENGCFPHCFAFLECAAAASATVGRSPNLLPNSSPKQLDTRLNHGRRNDNDLVRRLLGCLRLVQRPHERRHALALRRRRERRGHGHVRRELVRRTEEGRQGSGSEQKMNVLPRRRRRGRRRVYFREGVVPRRTTRSG